MTADAWQARNASDCAASSYTSKVAVVLAGSAEEHRTSDHDSQHTAAQEPQISPFDAIRQVDADGADGNAYWSARALAEALDYAKRSNFTKVILQARIACEASGYAVSDHIADVGNMVVIGSGARRKIADVRLSRYACYLVCSPGGKMPEEMPTPRDSIKEVEKRERQRLEREAQERRQPRLIPPDGDTPATGGRQT